MPAAETPAALRAHAEALIEHYPGEHAAMDAAQVTGQPSRHDIRRQLLARARLLEAVAMPKGSTWEEIRPVLHG